MLRKGTSGIAGMLLAMTCAVTAHDGAGGDMPPSQAADVLESGQVAGRSLGDWTVEWWRWALSQWVAPYQDPDGRFCDMGQGEAVWFLAGTDGTFRPKRTCVIPEGRHVLVPVINMIYWQPHGSRTPCAELRASAAVNNDHLASAVVLLDGKPLGDIRLHRVRSEGCFRLRPDDPDSSLGAADGYWLMLKPLPRGRHTLSVGANYDASKRGYGAMHQNFEYVLDVGGPNLLGATDILY